MLLKQIKRKILKLELRKYDDKKTRTIFFDLFLQKTLQHIWVSEQGSGINLSTFHFSFILDSTKTKTKQQFSVFKNRSLFFHFYSKCRDAFWSNKRVFKSTAYVYLNPHWLLRSFWGISSPHHFTQFKLININYIKRILSK